MAKPLRIAFFLYEFPVVSETFVLNEITGLIDLGHEVTIFAERSGAQPLEHEDIGRYRLYERTRYLDMPAPHLTRVLEAARRFRRTLGRPLLHSLDTTRYGPESRSLRLYYWTLLMSGRNDFDIVHCHFGPRGRMAVFLREIGAISGKIVTVFHGVDASAYLRQDPAVYRHLFANGDLFLAASEAFRARLVRHGCDPQRTFVHSMGIDLRRFPYRNVRREPGETLQVLTVGRLVEKKGIEFGLRSIAELKARRAPAHYTIVGDGPLRPALEALSVELGIDGNVSFLGWRDQAAVAALLLESDVLLFPSVTDSRGDQEAVPVVLKEAMATGVPVVATKHGGIPELVDDGVTGLLAAERDATGLANALQRLGCSRSLGYRLALHARERIVANLDIQMLNRRLVTHFRDLLGHGPQAPSFVPGVHSEPLENAPHVHA